MAFAINEIERDPGHRALAAVVEEDGCALDVAQLVDGEFDHRDASGTRYDFHAGSRGRHGDVGQSRAIDANGGVAAVAGAAKNGRAAVVGGDRLGLGKEGRLAHLRLALVITAIAVGVGIGAQGDRAAVGSWAAR
jgi:hypothetical protein